MTGEPGLDELPDWLTGAEARFVVGVPPEVIRDDVVAGRVTMFRPFGPGHRVAFFRTEDLLASRARRRS